MTRVILVEDHDHMRQCLKLMVEKIKPCKVVAEAPCGVLAIDTIENTPADLILLDLSLPRVSGIDVLKCIRPKTKAKILAVTLFTDDQTIRAALDAGADGIFSKEKGGSDLKAAIVEVLSGQILN